jgi:hypothetical protein
MIESHIGVRVMATAPTAEDSARRILSIFAKNNLRAGEMLMLRQIIVAFQGGVFGASDLPIGAEYAEEREWLRFDGNRVTLLDKGFDEM